MRLRHVTYPVIATAAAAAITLAGCGSSGGSSATGTKELKIGFLTPVTGDAASSFGEPAVKGFQARIDAANAAGEIPGYHLKVEVADDTSTPQGNITAVQNLVRDNVDVVGSWDPFLYAGYRPLVEKHIPVVGGSIGGPQFGDKSIDNFISVLGSVNPNYTTYDGYGKMLKARGVTKLAVLGYGVSPASKGSASAFDGSANAAGIGTCLKNFSIPFGGSDFTSVALAIKNAGCDGVYAAMTSASNVALATALKNAKVNLKATVVTTGYEQSTLDSSSVSQAMDGVEFITPTTPIETPNAGVKTELAQLKKYAGFEGIPGYGMYGGWLTADAIVTGLKAAGSNQTSQAFLDAMHKIDNYTGNGVLAGPANFTVPQIGIGDHVLDGGTCFYSEKLTADKFHTVPGGPYCGQLVPGSKPNI